VFDCENTTEISKDIGKEIQEFCNAEFPSLIKDYLEDKKQVQSLQIHEKIACSSCSFNPIVGIRYKCTVCQNYDLCDYCETRNVHSEHIMLKIRKPEFAPLSFVSQ